MGISFYIEVKLLFCCCYFLKILSSRWLLFWSIHLESRNFGPLCSVCVSVLAIAARILFFSSPMVFTWLVYTKDLWFPVKKNHRMLNPASGLATEDHSSKRWDVQESVHTRESLTFMTCELWCHHVGITHSSHSFLQVSEEKTSQLSGHNIKKWL